jgi:hypothetical protein
VLRILGAPLLVLIFTICAFFSPSRGPRIALVSAALMEMAVSLYIGVVWLLPLLTERR